MATAAPGHDVQAVGQASKAIAAKHQERVWIKRSFDSYLACIGEANAKGEGDPADPLLENLPRPRVLILEVEAPHQARAARHDGEGHEPGKIGPASDDAVFDEVVERDRAYGDRAPLALARHRLRAAGAKGRCRRATQKHQA